MSNNFTIKDEDLLISSLQNIVKAIKTQENPEELNRYRKIFKKAVPLTMRSYVSAYLIREAKSLNLYSRDFKKDGQYKWQSSFKNISSGKLSRPKIVLPEEESVSLFLGIGRKRGIFPKDVITLLIQGAGVARDHIGDIRILDNYCFVQVMANEAEEIIAKLNNSYYRGKNLTVSHSRKHEMEENDYEETINVNAEENVVEGNNINSAETF